MALFRYNRGTTRALVPFTASKEALLDGLAKLAKMPPGRPQLVRPGRTGLPARRGASSSQSRAEHHPQLLRAVEGPRGQRPRRPPSRHRGPRRTLGQADARLRRSRASSSAPGRRWAASVGIRGLQQFEYDVSAELPGRSRRGERVGGHDLRDRRPRPDDRRRRRRVPAFGADAFERTAVPARGPRGPRRRRPGGVLFENRNVFKSGRRPDLPGVEHLLLSRRHPLEPPEEGGRTRSRFR